MKSIDGWTIIKALNKHDDLAIKLIDDSIYMTKVSYDKRKGAILDEYPVILKGIESIDRLLNGIADVMTKKNNKIYVNNKMKKQDVYLYLIAYNKAFKERETLKLELYDYIGTNESSYTSITISKDSARNLYKELLIAKQILNNK